MKIFISYRRADSTYLVGRIKDRLISVFGDQSVFRDLDDIPAGTDFRTVLERETNACNVMLVIIGPQWAGITDAEGNRRLADPADYTRIEVETGLKRLVESKTTVIPVLVMNASMPSTPDLPESLGQLAYQNAISIRNDPDFHNDMERLIRDMKRIGEEITVQYFEPETIHIREGRFLMGSPERAGHLLHETPQHEVDLPSYRIGKYPVTNAQYEEFIRQTKRLVSPSMGWDGQRVPIGWEQYPVSGVIWYEALEYCRWLSEQTGRKYSLPNEAQWEKAARGGANSMYPWGDEVDPKRSNYGCSALAAVDAFPPQNDFGCFDLVGNIRQWTCSLWGEKRVSPDPRFAYPWKDDQRNDPNASRQIRRVVRGSSMREDAKWLRCSARSGQAPDDPGLPDARHGFRVVMLIS